MSAFTIFFCAGLLVYWVCRTGLLLHGSCEAIDETLACDLRWGRRVLLSLRTMFLPPQSFVG